MAKINVLILGSGGREHAIGWKLSQSPLLNRLFFAPGNPGTALLGTNVTVQPTDFEGVKSVVVDNSISLVVAGPEDPLVQGIHDFFRADEHLNKVNFIGPCKEGAQLEGSKDFAKQFMIRHGIPTARYKSFSDQSIDKGKEYLKSLRAPYVLKADGLAAGKGVYICDTLAEAERGLDDMLLGHKFGRASQTVVIEEFLKGIELSVFVLTDGKSYILLPEAKDYKRVGEGDTGLNTGGMGSVSPVPFASKAFLKKVEETIVRPTIEGLSADGISYKGFIFFGLMKVGDEPYVIEYNVRLGDPETESVMPRIKSDLLEMLLAVDSGSLQDHTIEIDEDYAVTVMLVSDGYPDSYEKGKPISIDNIQSGSLIFHSGTALLQGNLATSGGRVIAVTSVASTMIAALEKSYATTSGVHFQGKNFRKDIGFDLM